MSNDAQSESLEVQAHFPLPGASLTVTQDAHAHSAPTVGSFVDIRSRPWLVESIEDRGNGLSILKLSCISDDAQGDQLEVTWNAEIGARVLTDDVGRVSPRTAPTMQ